MDAKMKKRQETPPENAAQFNEDDVTWIALADLNLHPDAAAYGADKDDRAMLEDSVKRMGVVTPLLVMEIDGCFQVLDGCGRYHAAYKAGLDRVPCVVVESCGDTRRFAAIANSVHRKVTTGSRVLSYAMMNRDRIVAAMEAADTPIPRVGHGDPHVKNGGVLRNKIPEDLEEWTFQEIAKRLSVSRKDVSYAVELMLCQSGGLRPVLDMHDGRKEREPIADPDEREALDQTFEAVLMGRLPVRRWTAGFKGKFKTDGQARAPINHLACAMRGVAALSTAFDGWHEIALADRQTVLDRFDELMRQAPDDVLHLLQKLLPPADGKKR